MLWGINYDHKYWEVIVHGIITKKKLRKRKEISGLFGKDMYRAE